MNTKTTNKESIRTNNHRAKRRQESKDYLGGLCALCKTSDDLQFDHINPEEKKFTISDAIANNMSWVKLVEELDKCQLLCVHCHKQKTISEQEVEHGGGITGKKNCYCDLCSPLKKQYMQEWYNNNK